MPKLIPVESSSQIETVAGLAHTIWNEHFPSIIGQAQVDYMVEKFQQPDAIKDQIKNGYLYFLIEHDGAMAGYVGVLPDATKGELMLSKFYVLESLRGKGLGRQVLGLIIKLANRLMLSTIWLTVNRHNALAIGAYEKMGFSTTGEICQDIGGGFVMDDFRMALSIPSPRPSTRAGHRGP